VKRIGLLSGMSWESSAEYYRLINELVRNRLGGLHSEDCVLRSVDFAEIEELYADTTAHAVRERELSTIGLLTTADTMEQDFYVGRRAAAHHAGTRRAGLAGDPPRLHRDRPVGRPPTARRCRCSTLRGCMPSKRSSWR